MSAQDAADQSAEVGADVFAQRPVDGDVAADRFDELTGDVAQRIVSEHLHRAVVGLQRVVEGQLVFGETELFSSRVGLSHLPGKLDQLLDDLRRLYRPILVATQRLLKHLGEGAGLYHILPPPRRHLAPQQLLQKLHREVAMRHPPDFVQELVGEHRRCPACPDLPRQRCPLTPSDETAREMIWRTAKVELLLGTRLGLRPLQESHPHRLKEPHVVTDACGLRVGHGQGEGLGQLPHGVQATLLAVLLGQHMLLGG